MLWGGEELLVGVSGTRQALPNPPPPGWLMSKASITPLYARDTAGDLVGTSQECSSLLPFLLSAQALVLAGESLCLQIYDESPWGPGQFLLNKATGPVSPQVAAGHGVTLLSLHVPPGSKDARQHWAPGTSPAAPLRD